MLCDRIRGFPLQDIQDNELSTLAQAVSYEAVG